MSLLFCLYTIICIKICLFIKQSLTLRLLTKIRTNMSKTKMKKIDLNVATRLMLLMNLPEQGSVTEMISKRNVRKKIDFSSEEVEALKIENKDNKIVWLPEKELLTVEFTDSEVDFLKSLIDKLDKAGSITDNILDFVEAIQS